MCIRDSISSFDAASFFQLHNFGGSGAWDVAEILRTYGVSPKSPAEAVQGSEDWAVRVVSDERRRELIDGVMTMFDTNRDGLISKEEYEEGVRQGKALPDFGAGAPARTQDAQTRLANAYNSLGLDIMATMSGST